MNETKAIEFHLDSRSGVSPYLQIVQQVRRALRLGLLREGDQLPTVKDVVARLAINPSIGVASSPCRLVATSVVASFSRRSIKRVICWAWVSVR